MTTKEQMLGRIRTALADVKDKPGEIPPPPEVWPVEGLSVDEMARRFQANLEAVQGEFVLCDDFDRAVERIKELLDEIGAKKLAVLDRPLSRRVAGKLSGKEFVFPPESPENVSPEFLATLDAGLVSPEFLLADTGSCVFAAPTAFDRLTTYIMPISIVIASTSMLRENMPAVWDELKTKLEPTKTGEFVFVTGPSRTADIEKILILGVHGPKRVVVFLVRD